MAGSFGQQPTVQMQLPGTGWRGVGQKYPTFQLSGSMFRLLLTCFWSLRCRHRGWLPLFSFNPTSWNGFHETLRNNICGFFFFFSPSGSQTFKDYDSHMQPGIWGNLGSHCTCQGKTGSEKPCGTCKLLPQADLEHRDTLQQENQHHPENPGERRWIRFPWWDLNSSFQQNTKWQTEKWESMAPSKDQN